MINGTVYADIKVSEDGLVEVFGKTKANTNVGVEVYKSSKGRKDLENLDESEYLNVITYHDQIISDSTGNYKFFVDVSGNSGEYDVYLGTRNSDFPKETFTYATEDDLYDIVGRIESPDTENLETIIANEHYKIGITSDELKKVNVETFADVLSETVKKYPLVGKERDKVIDIIDEAYFIARLNDKLVGNIFDEEVAIRHFENGELKEWYKKSWLTDDFRNVLTTRLSGKNFTTIDDYKNFLTDNFILSVIQEPNGVGNIKDIMLSFENLTGITVSNYVNTKWSLIAGKKYDNFTQVKKALSHSETNGGGSGNGSSGGNSGGNNKGGSSTKVFPAENIKDKVINPFIFDDISDIEWARDAIVSLAEKQIINGTGDGKFSPNDVITREQFCKILVKAFEVEEGSLQNIFTDTDGNAWYFPFVIAAYNKGIVNGMDEGTFGVGKAITRQDMCVMIYRAAGLSAAEDNEKFSDDNEISDYAKEAVYALRENGAVSGVNDDEFAPHLTATRAQAAKIIYRILESR